MLREKKYNKLKYLGLNSLFSNFIDDTLYTIEYPIMDNYISNSIIQTSTNFTIIKENILEPYLITLDNIIVLHITEAYINDFEFLYKKSTDYVFDIYKTSYEDLKTKEIINIYHIFCISKYLTPDIDYISFLSTNDCSKRYTYLSIIYGPCLLINKRFDILTKPNKENAKYKYIKTIGKGIINKSIKNFIKSIINMSNLLQDSLPPHYLRI